MEDNRMDETPKTADTAEAEVGNTAAELGKFKDVATLMQAYRALEDRKSTRLNSSHMA